MRLRRDHEIGVVARKQCHPVFTCQDLSIVEGIDKDISLGEPHWCPPTVVLHDVAPVGGNPDDGDLQPTSDRNHHMREQDRQALLGLQNLFQRTVGGVVVVVEIAAELLVLEQHFPQRSDESFGVNRLRRNLLAQLVPDGVGERIELPGEWDALNILVQDARDQPHSLFNVDLFIGLFRECLKRVVERRIRIQLSHKNRHTRANFGRRMVASFKQLRTRRIPNCSQRLDSRFSLAKHVRTEFRDQFRNVHRIGCHRRVPVCPQTPSGQQQAQHERRSQHEFPVEAGS